MARLISLALIAGAVILGGVALVAALPAFAGQSKSDVCHITGSYDFGTGDVSIGHVINIADPALDSHVEHGDTAAFIEAALPDGTGVCVFLGDSNNDDVADYLEICFTDGTNSFELYWNGLIPSQTNLGDLNNTFTYLVRDCSGNPETLNQSSLGTTLAADDEGAAEQACRDEITANGSTVAFLSISRWVDMDPAYNAPGDWWLCITEPTGDEIVDDPLGSDDGEDY